MSLIEDKAIVLFQGDSITDAERNRSDPAHMGHGYALMASSWFSALYPEKQVQFFNRGIAGDRVYQLQDRWQTDCLDLQPTWLSILIGINDNWHTDTPEFEERYRALLENTASKLQARLILCEPFYVTQTDEGPKWRALLDPKIAIVRQLARDFNALYVPFDGLFAQATTQRSPQFWAPDGVHPSNSGHALMAQAWLRAVKAL